jgi:hypothetical protein
VDSVLSGRTWNLLHQAESPFEEGSAEHTAWAQYREARRQHYDAEALRRPLANELEEVRRRFATVARRVSRLQAAQLGDERAQLEALKAQGEQLLAAHEKAQAMCEITHRDAVECEGSLLRLLAAGRRSG